MDTLRLAIPRNQYTDDEMISQLRVIGAFFVAKGFADLKGGLEPIEYVDNGFYHFGATYNFNDKEEFDLTVAKLNQMSKVLVENEPKPTKGYGFLRQGSSIWTWSK